MYLEDVVAVGLGGPGVVAVQGGGAAVYGGEP